MAAFVADKDRAHSRLAGVACQHTRARTVDGRTGYVWTHGSRTGYWYYAAWFPHPEHSACGSSASPAAQAPRFKRLCAEAIGVARVPLNPDRGWTLGQNGKGSRTPFSMETTCDSDTW